MLKAYNCFDCDGHRTMRCCYQEDETLPDGECKYKSVARVDLEKFLSGLFGIREISSGALLRRYLARISK